MWGTKKYNKKPRIALSIIFALYALVLYTATTTDPNNTNIAQNQTSLQSNNNSEELDQVVTKEQASQPIGQTVCIAASDSGTKYHSNPNCSRMNGTIQLSIEEAISTGYTACSKCY